MGASDKRLKPNVLTYNTLLTALSRTTAEDAANRSEKILRQMFRLSDAGEEDCRPDIQSFTSVINCWAKSRDSHKAKNAQRVLRQMRSIREEVDESLRPNVFTYGAVLNACAHTYGDREAKNEALTVAIETFQEMNSKSDGVQGNHVTYGTFLRAITTLMEEDDDRRDRLVEQVFRRCCRDGQVGSAVLKQISIGVPHLYMSLLGKKAVYGMVGVEDIPSDWTRNVRERKRSVRKNHR